MLINEPVDLHVQQDAGYAIASHVGALIRIFLKTYVDDPGEMALDTLTSTYQRRSSWID